MAHDVFVSYPHDDKALADGLVHRLETDGIRCWVAPRDVPPGADWAGAIVEAIGRSRVLVLVFSDATNSSEHIVREVRAASDAHLVIVPFRTTEAEPAPALNYYIGGTHWLDAVSEPIQHHFAELAVTITRLLGSDGPARPAPEPMAVASATPDDRSWWSRVPIALKVGSSAVAAAVLIGVAVLVANSGSDADPSEPEAASTQSEPSADIGEEEPADREALTPDDPGREPQAVDSGESTVEEPAGEVQVETVRTERFSIDGAEFGGFGVPIGVAIDGNGRVLVTDETKDAVRVFDAEGTYLESFPASDPHGIAVGPDGAIYVTSHGSGTVDKFDAEGNLLLSWGGSGEFEQPIHVAVDAAGFVYVTATEASGRRVQKFDSEGRVADGWSMPEEGVVPLFGIATGEFESGIVIFVGEVDSGTVYRSRDDGSPAGDQWRADAPNGLDVDEVGDVYVAGGGVVTRHDSNGSLLESWSSESFGETGPFDVAVDDSGGIWVTDQFSGLLIHFG